ncbi:MAG: metallophosphoesterase family protein [Erysipelotrichia bacterium]|nr:metallophosphoesterase family protein [Erysipelotrichia bacterium]
MVILLVSDSHGDTATLKRLVDMYPKMDMYLHAGDSESDEYTLKPFVSVRGNCDRYRNFNDYLLIPTPYGKMYIQHKPHFSHSIIKKENVKICIHGHTHIRRKESLNGIMYINPGAISYARDCFEGSYVILTIDTETIRVNFYTLK